jgi:dual specificity tyrosine-phosphorylation-regulated kinase 2/3/4
MIATGKVPFSARITPHMPAYSKPSNRAPRRRPHPPASARSNPRMRSRRGTAKSASPVVQNGPTSPDDASQRYGDFLTAHELDEIFTFPDIFYVGNRSSKMAPGPDSEFNSGFDDEDHNLRLVVGDHLAHRFGVVSLFGVGAFGQVARCIDHKTKKVIVNRDQMHAQGQIEATVLSKLSGNDPRHIVRAFDYFIFRSHICITFEILGINLFGLSESNEFHPLPPRLVRLCALQMFAGLDQCHRIGVIHCDVKPENVLLVPGSNTLIKLIDFGSSCFEGHQKYEYIQSRFYRAPEVLFGLHYATPMDIWSAALVIAELLIGRPLFPGEDEQEQAAMIAELLGEPDIEVIRGSKRWKDFFGSDGRMTELMVTYSRVPGSMNLKEVIQTNDVYLVDFLLKCLTWDPEKRMTAQQAMQHPWIRMKEVHVGSNQEKLLPGLR